MSQARVKVLYIAGNTRSGSTILHNILSQLDGFIGIGELRDIWTFNFMENRLCGCGQPFAECPFWQAVVAEAFGSVEGATVEHMAALTSEFTVRRAPRLALPTLRKRYQPLIAEYQLCFRSIYSAIHEVSQGQVIVDSSKHPLFAYLMQRIPELDVYVIHLVRDARGVSHSWTRRKQVTPGSQASGLMARHHPLRSAIQWDSRVLLSELLLRVPPERFMRLRYEDFVREPRRHVEQVLRFVDEAPPELPFTGEHTVEMQRVVHSLYGNPVRFKQGPVELRSDEAWRTELRWWDRLLVTAVTWPLLWWLEYLPFIQVS